jgi:hypothetical protein
MARAAPPAGRAESGGGRSEERQPTGSARTDPATVLSSGATYKAKADQLCRQKQGDPRERMQLAMEVERKYGGDVGRVGGAVARLGEDADQDVLFNREGPGIEFEAEEATRGEPAGGELAERVGDEDHKKIAERGRVGAEVPDLPRAPGGISQGCLGGSGVEDDVPARRRLR